MPLDSNYFKKLFQISNNKVVIELGFGGAAASYAVYVHENLTAKHTVGQAKYLEVPFKNAQTGMSRRIVRKIDQQMRQVMK